MLNYLDLFAGAGGLSEGFIQAGYNPIAHVEISRAACNTLKTRTAFHWLRNGDGLSTYNRYLAREMSRQDLYGLVPTALLESVINREISDTWLDEIFGLVDRALGGRRLDLIIGGPPCQAYSLAGRARDKNRMIGDKRNYLYLQYAKFLAKYSPRFFVFENVLGLLSARDNKGVLYLDNMRHVFRNAGYQTELMTLSAEDYGVPQSRKRIVIVGKLGTNGNFYPEPPKWKPSTVISDVFRDLPPICAGGGSEGPVQPLLSRALHLSLLHIPNDDVHLTWHKARPNTHQDLAIYRLAVNLWNSKKERLDYNILPADLKTHSNRESFLDRFKVVAGDLGVSHTIVAHIAKDGHYYIHPDLNQNRSISVREAARLQTFPDDYYFEGVNRRPERTPAFRQIGNAVPVFLARRIAERIQEMW